MDVGRGLGRCERCDTPVEERTLRQWFLRTTAYADRLVAGLDDLDWPAKAKNRQRAWIGRRRAADGRVEYRLRDWLISRQRYWGPPIPVVHCDGCGAVPVPDDQLPVLLPESDDLAALQPDGDGRSPLARFADWVCTDCPRCGGEARRETDVSDTFLDSAWYFLRYPSADIDDRPWDAARTAAWLPVAQCAGGPEHVTRHHLYARFVCMALHDQGLVPFAEPFPRLRLHGMLTMGGAKMSKSRGNVVNPDEMVAAHGADVTRLALLFTRPWDADGDFDPAVITGAERFLSRVWRLVTSPPPPPPEPAEPDPAAPDPGVAPPAPEGLPSAGLLRPDTGPVPPTADVGAESASAAAHGAGRDDGPTAPEVGVAVAKVTGSIERMQFNTAIAALMTLVGQLRGTRPTLATRRALVSLLAPLAPHIADELWRNHLGQDHSVHVEPWPDTA